MIIQPERGIRNENNFFYESEGKRIDALNREFFRDIKLTNDENRLLVWLCGLDDWTVKTVMDVFRKVKGL